MTGITLQACDEMTLRFPGRFLAVMTGGTLADGAGIMNISGRDPSGRLMTGVALRTGDNMIGRFSGGRLPIMTGGTLTGGAGIVNIGGRSPSGRLVTTVALCRGRNMVGRFPGRFLIVVAGGALAGNKSKAVLERGRRKGRYAVAEIATLGGRDMVLGFSIGNLIVMTIFTVSRSMFVLSPQVTFGAFESPMGAQ